MVRDLDSGDGPRGVAAPAHTRLVLRGLDTLRCESRAAAAHGYLRMARHRLIPRHVVVLGPEGD